MGDTLFVVGSIVTLILIVWINDKIDLRRKKD